MFAFDVVVIHFFEREDLVAILTGVFKFNAFPVNFHKMSPILKQNKNCNQIVMFSMELETKNLLC